jgi:hypothetical protein
LVDLQCSQFERMFVTDNNQAFITILGITRSVFDEQVSDSTPYYKNYSPHNSSQFFTRIRDERSRGGGCPRKVNARFCVALCVSYFWFTGAFCVLQGWFGFTATSILVWFRLGLCILISLVENKDDIKVQMPDGKKSKSISN